jgi:hypothetical protein
MDQSEIDALVNGSDADASEKAETKKKKSKTKEAKPKTVKKEKTDASTKKEEKAVIKELDNIASVTERETNKLMDKLDEILAGTDGQQKLLQNLKDSIKDHLDEMVMVEFNKLEESVNLVRESVFQSMDLLQFQDITRQKLEKIVYHLKQIHDYIVELLGIGEVDGFNRDVTFSKAIHSVGTTPDEKKDHAESVIKEFQQKQKKGN